MDFINKLAVKYRSNPVAKILFAPLWHLYMPYNLKKRNRFFRLYGMELLSKVKKVLDSEDCFFWLDLEHYWVLIESMLSYNMI